MKNKNISYFELLYTLFIINAFTFGGGYTIVPIIKDKFVNDLDLIDEKQMLNIVSLGQSVPGAMAISTSFLVGYKLKGFLGAIVAVLGAILPCIFVISLISYAYISFISNEYRVQVGNHDYYIDLLFYHRGLSCLVAFELKIGEFKPEYVGKMNLYLEALDREVKKQTENPSVGVILCASKDDEVVEFALSRSLSPTMVSEYTLKLIDKNLLQKKLKEYTEIAEEKVEANEENEKGIL